MAASGQKWSWSIRPYNHPIVRGKYYRDQAQLLYVSGLPIFTDVSPARECKPPTYVVDLCALLPERHIGPIICNDYQASLCP